NLIKIVIFRVLNKYFQCYFIDNQEIKQVFNEVLSKNKNK
ncbi:MAG: hypothetical protein RL711_1433, partial [Bacteroidota bacterium]